MYVKEEYEKPSYLQTQYPIINFFYYTAVKYKVLEINVVGTALEKGRNYQLFWDASTWEQYMLFLVIFLFDGAFAEHNLCGYSNNAAEMWTLYVDSFMEWVDREKPCNGIKYQLSGESKIMYFRGFTATIPYLQELRLIEVWSRPSVREYNEEYCWGIETCPLLEIVSDVYENTQIAEEEATNRDILIQWWYEAYADRLVKEQKQGDLVRIFEHEGTESPEQTIDLEVTIRYTDCVRVIRMNMTDSLYDLHRMIQKAVEFDDDHLFEFSFGNGMVKRTYALPECLYSDRDKSVKDTELWELELRKGQKFTYLFDFEFYEEDLEE